MLEAGRKAGQADAAQVSARSGERGFYSADASQAAIGPRNDGARRWLIDGRNETPLDELRWRAVGSAGAMVAPAAACTSLEDDGGQWSVTPRQVPATSGQAGCRCSDYANRSRLVGKLYSPGAASVAALDWMRR